MSLADFCVHAGISAETGARTKRDSCVACQTSIKKGKGNRDAAIIRHRKQGHLLRVCFRWRNVYLLTWLGVRTTRDTQRGDAVVLLCRHNMRYVTVGRTNLPTEITIKKPF